jgi:endo-1,4-beta-xylanase
MMLGPSSAVRPFSKGRAWNAAAFVTTALCLSSCAGADSPGDGATGGTSGRSGGLAGLGGRPSSTAGQAGSGGSSAGRAGNAAVAGTPGAGGSGNVSGGPGSAGAAGTSAGVGGQAGQLGGQGGAAAGAAGHGGAPAAGTGGESGRGGTSGVAGSGGNIGTGGLAGMPGSAGSDNTPAPPVGKKFVGNIDARNQIRTDFVEYWNQFTAENAGKWASIERTQNEMNWSRLDTMYAYAKQHNILIKHHNFVWGSQQPSWLSGLSQEEQRAEVEEWIRLFCERYPDVPLIDVVNEPPPHTTPPYVAALGGAGASGYDWIAQVFKWAHQYCPNSILILNDYNNIEYSSDNQHTIDIAKKIKAAGAPIHAIGAQAHDAYKMSTSTVQGYIDQIASQTGLPVYISEYDIDIADDNQQKSVMQSQFTMFWNNDHVKGITIWGYVSGMTWKANTGLMSSSGTMRPAMTWLLDFLKI